MLSRRGLLKVLSASLVPTPSLPRFWRRDISAAVSAEQVSRLRAETGAPVMLCKHALVESNGAISDARDILLETAERQRAAATSAPCRRLFAEISEDRSALGVATLGCETDFCARTPEFEHAGRSVARSMLPGGAHPSAALRETYLRTQEDLVVHDSQALRSSSSSELFFYARPEGDQLVAIDLEGAGALSEGELRSITIRAMIAGWQVSKERDSLSPSIRLEGDLLAPVLASEAAPRETVGQVLRRTGARLRSVTWFGVG